MTVTSEQKKAQEYINCSLASGEAESQSQGYGFKQQDL
jgi:hypothetical protein